MVEHLSLKPDPIDCKVCQLSGSSADACSLVKLLTQEERAVRLTTPERRKLLKEIGEALQETRANCQSMCGVSSGGISPNNPKCERLKNIIKLRLDANF